MVLVSLERFLLQKSIFFKKINPKHQLKTDVWDSIYL